MGWGMGGERKGDRDTKEDKTEGVQERGRERNLKVRELTSKALGPRFGCNLIEISVR